MKKAILLQIIMLLGAAPVLAQLTERATLGENKDCLICKGLVTGSASKPDSTVVKLPGEQQKVSHKKGQ